MKDLHEIIVVRASLQDYEAYIGEGRKSHGNSRVGKLLETIRENFSVIIPFGDLAYERMQGENRRTRRVPCVHLSPWREHKEEKRRGLEHKFWDDEESSKRGWSSSSTLDPFRSYLISKYAEANSFLEYYLEREEEFSEIQKYAQANYSEAWERFLEYCKEMGARRKEREEFRKALLKRGFSEKETHIFAPGGWDHEWSKLPGSRVQQMGKYFRKKAPALPHFKEELMAGALLSSRVHSFSPEIDPERILGPRPKEWKIWPDDKAEILSFLKE